MSCRWEAGEASAGRMLIVACTLGWDRGGGTLLVVACALGWDEGGGVERGRGNCRKVRCRVGRGGGTLSRVEDCWVGQGGAAGAGWWRDGRRDGGGQASGVWGSSGWDRGRVGRVGHGVGLWCVCGVSRGASLRADATMYISLSVLACLAAFQCLR